MSPKVLYSEGNKGFCSSNEKGSVCSPNVQYSEILKYVIKRFHISSRLVEFTHV